MADLLPPLRPIAIKERLSILFIEKGHLDVLDGAFAVVDKSGVRTHIPVGGVACLMLEPGTRTSHLRATIIASPKRNRHRSVRSKSVGFKSNADGQAAGKWHRPRQSLRLLPDAGTPPLNIVLSFDGTIY